MKSNITSACKYAVEQLPCHHYMTPVDHKAAPTAILHTTEGWWNPSLTEFKHKFAPHFLVGLKDKAKKEYGIAQLVPIGFMGAACRAHNDQALVQVEMVGFSQEKLWLPDAATLELLASLMATCFIEWNIPLAHAWPDGNYPRAGDNPHRHAGILGKTGGWFGHGDMPAPDVHWDPGNLEWSKVFDRAHELVGH